MHKLDMSGITKTIRLIVNQHSPEILTGIGIAGMITTVVLAVKATPKAIILIEEAKREEIGEGDFSVVHARPLKLIQTTWTCYIPAAVTGCLSVACLIGASSVNVRRNAALATAYSLSESALKEYREKVIETIGEKKEHAVNDAIAKEKIDRDPVTNHEVIITERGNTLCYDAISGRYFKSDIDKLKKAANDLNRSMFGDMYVSLNEFYYEIGMEGIKLGEELGWNIEKGLIDLKFSSQLACDGTTPCLVIDYSIAPKYNYRKSL